MMIFDLTKLQQQAIELLSRSPLKDKFYWTGGTLLAYHYFHHRKSLDLDFFSSSYFSFEEVNEFAVKLKKQAGFSKVSYQRIFDRFEFFFENQETLRIEFVLYNGEKKPLKKKNKLLGVSIDSLEDIAANKVVALFDRREPKDLFDIYFFLTRGFSVRKLLKLAYQKFGVRFTESLFWSETFKSLPLFAKLKPLLLEDVKKQNKLLSKITIYFKQRSSKFLQGEFDKQGK